jgi:aspartyl-tRNA(Asn)/glutamyl-tRNA(Gln) amidotransferase subunit B
MSKYQTVVGLELHCELKTKSKVFSPSANDYSILPNSNVNEIDMSFPGILPSLNKEAVKKALKMSMILNCEVPDELLFDRKNYYYPDLPKGYQITQIRKPVGINGNVKLICKEEEFNVDIHDIHLEEDTASLDHYDYYSLIDYNRCGVPLIEIVTRPCFHSGEEAVTFLEFLANSFKYADISDADTKKGQIRCDVNVNLKNDKGEYVTPKVEIKNINSFANVALAINYEAKRQEELLDSGKTSELVQETRRFDDITNTTIRMRVKVDSEDYKYFVEPNIPRIKINKDWLKEIKDEIPMLPNERMILYINKYNISSYDAAILTRDKKISDYFNECLKLKIEPKLAANWIISNIIGLLNKENITIDDFYISPERLSQILKLLSSGEISSKQAKDLFNLVYEAKCEVEEVLNKYEIKQLDNDDELNKIIDDILKVSAMQIEAYQNGKTNMFNYFVGEVMKQTKGKANPIRTKEILMEKLKK